MKLLDRDFNGVQTFNEADFIMVITEADLSEVQKYCYLEDIPMITKVGIYERRFSIRDQKEVFDDCNVILDRLMNANFNKNNRNSIFDTYHDEDEYFLPYTEEGDEIYKKKLLNKYMKVVYDI